MSEKINFSRATGIGWIPVEGFSVGRLAVASYPVREDERDGLTWWGIFHPETGMVIPRCSFDTLRDAMEMARAIGKSELWSKIVKTGDAPGDVEIPQDVKNQLGKIVSDFLARRK